MINAMDAVNDKFGDFAVTYRRGVKYGRPCLIIQLDAVEMVPTADAIRWINGQYISVLNIAGPRESKVPGGIYSEACSYLEKVFIALKELP